MNRDGKIWNKQFDLIPGIYLIRFKVDQKKVHNSTQPFVTIGCSEFNVVCIGSNFSFEMVKHLYSVLPIMCESDCEKEVDSFLQTFPGYPIDLFFDDDIYYHGTLLHFACLYEREKIVSLLVSKKANLSLKFKTNAVLYSVKRFMILSVFL